MAMLPDFGTGLNEVVTTIRISGVPSHVTEADFNCWFMFAPGFERATLAPNKGPPGSPQAGWAKFNTVEEAQTAIMHLNGRQLTAEQSASGGVLSAEIAKKNFKPRNPLKQTFETRETHGVQPEIEVPSLLGLDQGWSSSWQQDQSASLVDVAQPSPSGAIPISTLFLWKLKQGTTEEQLSHMFSEYCTGFERMKFVEPTDAKWGMCFVKFLTVAHASTALQTISCLALPSNPAEALAVDYAKGELDQPKQAGHAASTGSQYRAPLALPVQPQAVPPRGNAPCDTMFVGNLAPSVSEDELANALTTLHGFERMKMVGEGTDKVMAFALFDSIQSCADAIQALHGNALPSAPTQAVLCQYSKNSLGKSTRI